MFSLNIVKIKIKVLVAQWFPTLSNPWTIAHQVRLSMKFSRQECLSWFLFPSPRDFPDPGIESMSPALQADFFYHLSH